MKYSVWIDTRRDTHLNSWKMCQRLHCNSIAAHDPVWLRCWCWIEGLATENMFRLSVWLDRWCWVYDDDCTHSWCRLVWKNDPSIHASVVSRMACETSYSFPYWIDRWLLHRWWSIVLTSSTDRYSNFQWTEMVGHDYCSTCPALETIAIASSYWSKSLFSVPEIDHRYRPIVHCPSFPSAENCVCDLDICGCKSIRSLNFSTNWMNHLMRGKYESFQWPVTPMVMFGFKYGPWYTHISAKSPAKPAAYPLSMASNDCNSLRNSLAVSRRRIDSKRSHGVRLYSIESNRFIGTFWGCRPAAIDAITVPTVNVP